MGPAQVERPVSAAGKRTLFVTWDGPRVNYLESLFLPIFAELGARGYPFDVLQFRWGEAQQRERIAQQCAQVGVGYRAVEIVRRGGAVGPLASAVLGGARVRSAIRHFGSDLVMPRSIFPSLAVLAGRVARLRPVLMDADGFELDERVEGGDLLSGGLGYRVLRDLEAQMVRLSRAVLVRTAASRDILVARAGPPVGPERFYVVTNGRDERVFHPSDEAGRLSAREELGVPPDTPLIIYVGSVGTRYRTQEIGDFALHVRRRRPDTRLVVLSGAPDLARAELAKASTDLAASTVIRRAPPEEVARYIAAADVGTAFIRSTLSTLGIAPVKVGEYLLCGTPVVGAAAIGRNDGAVADGVFFDDAAGLEAAADWFVQRVLSDRDGYRDRARRAGVAGYSLRRSVDDYAAALEAAFSTAPDKAGTSSR